MRRTRFMSMMFLALSLAFFFVQEFRWGLEVPYLAFKLTGAGWNRPGGFLLVSTQQVRALAAQHPEDAEVLAFAALHLREENWEEAARLADQAVARDPKLTWVYYPVAYGKGWDKWTDPAAGQRVQAWIAKLQAWDPDNAIPYLLAGEYRKKTAKPPTWDYLIPTDESRFKVAAQHPEWIAAMERAYQQPRYDSYSTRYFDLQRKILLRQGWATPAEMVIALASGTIPNLLNIRDYANFVVFYQGKNAEKAGHLDQALQQYAQVSTFARRMRLGSATLIETLIGIAVDRIAAQEMRDALKRAGRGAEALPLELRLAEETRYLDTLRKDPLNQQANNLWQSAMIVIFAFLVVVFGAISLLAVAYVNAKRCIRREKRGRLYNFFTTLENYAPVLLFFSCLGLYLFYAPFAQNFHYFMTASEVTHNMEPFFFHASALPQFSYSSDLPPENPFRSYQWWALLIVVLTILLAAWDARAARRAAASKVPSPGPGR